MAREQRRVIEAEPRQRGGTHVGQEYVGARDQLERDLARGRLAEVEHDAALAAIVVLEDGIPGQICAQHSREGARGGADSGRLELDHGGAPRPPPTPRPRRPPPGLRPPPRSPPPSRPPSVPASRPPGSPFHTRSGWCGSSDSESSGIALTPSAAQRTLTLPPSRHLSRNP